MVIKILVLHKAAAQRNHCLERSYKIRKYNSETGLPVIKSQRFHCKGSIEIFITCYMTFLLSVCQVSNVSFFSFITLNGQESTYNSYCEIQTFVLSRGKADESNSLIQTAAIQPSPTPLASKTVL